MEHISLSRTILALCHDAVPAIGGATISARALSTALAITINKAEDPGLILALVIRDLSEAAMRSTRIKTGMPPRERRRRSKNVVDLSAVRRGKRLDPEPA
jgi:hypothetical protein